jgi:2-polyprenyl-6-methoxyphenol hydroxylase-like FAD-dependent oxidoreductase
MSRRAIIIGAGIGGLCAAIALRKVGYTVQIFERAPEVTALPTGLALWSNAMWALSILGVGDEVLRLGSVIDITRSQTAEGEVMSDVHVGNIGKKLGVPTVCIHRVDLHQILVNAVGRESIQTSMTCTGFVQDGRQVIALFENGTTVRGDLLVGADGYRSIVRRQQFPSEEARYSGYTCYRSVVSMVHRALPPGTALTALGHGSEFGLFPCGMGRVYWFATHNQPAAIKDSALGRKGDCLAAFAGFSEPFVQVLHATPESAIVRHDVYDRPPLPQWSSGRVTMLGDACHAMTPNLGQGACMAIEDAVVLARTLRDEPDCERALHLYEQTRRARTALIATRSYYLGKILTLEDGVLSWFRDRLMTTKLGEAQTESILEKLLSYQVPDL